nr:MAG TPA: Tail tape measure [Caudoviricetes sp.]
MDGMGNSVQRWAGIVAGAFSVREVTQMADAFTALENRLKVAGLAGADLAGVQNQLFQVASRNGVEIGALGELYGRLALATGELGVSQSDLMRFTEGVSAALRVQGTSSAAASGSLMQLAQAMSAGTVRAEELNSIMEGTPIIAQAAAQGMGVSVGQLRQQVLAGTVTSQAFFQALMRGFPEIEKQAEGATLTIGQSLTGLRNELIRVVGQTDDTLGASERMSAAITGLAENIDHIIPILAGLAAAWGVGYVASVVAAGTATATLNKALTVIAAHPIIATLTVLTAGLTAIALEAQNVERSMGDLNQSLAEARTAIEDQRRATDASAKAVSELGGEAGSAAGQMTTLAGSTRDAAASLYELANAKRAAALADLETRRQEVSRDVSELQQGSRQTRRQNFWDELNFSGRNAVTPGESLARGRRFFAGEWNSFWSGGASDQDIDASIAEGMKGLRELDAEARRIATLPFDHWEAEARRLAGGVGGGGGGGGARTGGGRQSVDRTPQLRAELDLEERLATVRATGDDRAIQAEEERQRLAQLTERYRAAGYADAESRAMQMLALENAALVVAEEKVKARADDAKAAEQVIDAMEREKALYQDALDFRREVARLAGDEATLREIEITRRTAEIRALNEQLSEVEARAQASAESGLLDAAEAYGNARDTFATAFRDGIMALAEGDLAGFAASLGQRFADQALNQLGEQLFDQMFGGFNAAAEGVTQGTSMAATVGPAITTAGATAAAAMATAITTAGATAATAMAAAMAGGKVIPGFADGGYTGAGGTHEPAGIVHRGEVVFSKADVARHGGAANVEALRKGLPGFAVGGPVGMPALPSSILTNGQVRGLETGGVRASGGSLSVSVDVSGANGDEAVARIARQAAAEGTAQAIAQSRMDAANDRRASKYRLSGRG